MEQTSQEFTASRWSAGNRLFPDTISLRPDGIHFTKGKLIGSNEEIINYRHIASVKLTTGLFLATLRIETSGGSQPVEIHGLWKGDARKIRDAIERMQGP